MPKGVNPRGPRGRVPRALSQRSQITRRMTGLRGASVPKPRGASVPKPVVSAPPDIFKGLPTGSIAKHLGQLKRTSDFFKLK